ncbi:MAG: ParA family protein [Thermoguttaceae bacterium]|jgi:hypothetical protein
MIRLGQSHSAIISGVNAAPNHRATAITVINLKGGVGKTHTVWLLAGVCQERGKKLLVIDADTQGNITKSLLLPAWNPILGVAALFDPRTHGIPITLHAPSSIEAGIARRLFAEVQRRINRSRRGGPSGGRRDVQREAVVAVA